MLHSEFSQAQLTVQKLQCSQQSHCCTSSTFLATFLTGELNVTLTLVPGIPAHNSYCSKKAIGFQAGFDLGMSIISGLPYKFTQMKFYSRFRVSPTEHNTRQLCFHCCLYFAYKLGISVCGAPLLQHARWKSGGNRHNHAAHSIHMAMQ